MKRLIIDGNSVFEIDLDCVKKHGLPESCELARHLKEYQKVGIHGKRTKNNDDIEVSFVKK